LLLTSPLRSWWASGAPPGPPAAAGVWALGLGTTAVSVFLSYALAFSPGWPLQLYVQKDIGTVQSNQAALGVASYVVTTAVLVGRSVVVSVGVAALLGGLAARPAPVTVRT